MKNEKVNTIEKAFEIRLATLGDSTVGKTSLITRYVENTFTLSYVQTMGFDSKMKKIKLKEGGDNIKVFLKDTAGQERFRSIAPNYIRNEDGILLVYDITEEQTFEGVKLWAKNIKDIFDDSKPMLLIGNKIDLNFKRKVKTEYGANLAETLGGIKFYETSCKTGENIEEAINDLVNQIYIKYIEANPNKENKNNKNIDLEKDNIKKDKKFCC